MTTPKTSAILLIGLCGMFAFVVGTELASWVVSEITPYLLFGVDQVEAQRIHAVESTRHRIEFSNGVTVQGIKLMPLDIVWAILSFTLLFSVWVSSVRLSIWLLRVFKPRLAEETLAFWKSLWRRGAERGHPLGREVKR